MNAKKYFRIYRILIGMLLILSALFLMSACLIVFFSGSFTPEKVYAVFQTLAAPLCITGSLALVGICLRPLFPQEEKENHKVSPLPVKVPPCLGLLRLVLGIVLLSFLIYGLFSGGTADVLAKAANICSECIGLG